MNHCKYPEILINSVITNYKEKEWKQVSAKNFFEIKMLSRDGPK